MPNKYQKPQVAITFKAIRDEMMLHESTIIKELDSREAFWYKQTKHNDSSKQHLGQKSEDRFRDVLEVRKAWDSSKSSLELMDFWTS